MVVDPVKSLPEEKENDPYSCSGGLRIRSYKCCTGNVPFNCPIIGYTTILNLFLSI